MVGNTAQGRGLQLNFLVSSNPCHSMILSSTSAQLNAALCCTALTDSEPSACSWRNSSHTPLFLSHLFFPQWGCSKENGPRVETILPVELLAWHFSGSFYPSFKFLTVVCQCNSQMLKTLQSKQSAGCTSLQIQREMSSKVGRKEKRWLSSGGYLEKQ